MSILFSLQGWKLAFIYHIRLTHNIYLFVSYFTLPPLFFVMFKIRLHKCFMDILIFVGCLCFLFRAYISCQDVRVKVELITCYLYLFFTHIRWTYDLPYVFPIKLLFHIKGYFLNNFLILIFNYTSKLDIQNSQRSARRGQSGRGRVWWQRRKGRQHQGHSAPMGAPSGRSCPSCTLGYCYLLQMMNDK